MGLTRHQAPDASLRGVLLLVVLFVAKVFERIDGFLGRLAYRAVGCVTALITVAAVWAAFGSATPWKGAQSLAALLMFGAGAVIAGWATLWCFSPRRTFGEFIAALEDGNTDLPSRQRRQRAHEAGPSAPL